MNKFKVGDKVDIFDDSYIFGIQNGKYSKYCSNLDGSRNNLTVIAIDLSAARLNGRPCAEQNHLSGQFSAANDLLVTNDKGSFWFTQSRFCKPTVTKHYIVIDNIPLEISHKAYLAFKKQFC